MRDNIGLTRQQRREELKRPNLGARGVEEDPDMELALDMIAQDGRPLVEIAKAAKLDVHTLYKWEKHLTRHPRNSSLNAVADACGYARVFVEKDRLSKTIYFVGKRKS